MRILGGLTIIVAIMGLLALRIPVTEAAPKPEYNIWDTLGALLVGIVYLTVASGLSKRKKWSWYLGVIAFVYSATHNFILMSPENIIAGLIALLLLAILIKEKKVIFKEQEKPIVTS